MQDFPTELHTHIATFLYHPPDLACLCRVSSYWLFIARPFLYRNVVLKDHLTTLNDTLALLQEDYELTKSIVSLTLITHVTAEAPDRRGKVSMSQLWIQLSDLAGLDNVRRFKLDGVPMMSASQFQQIFSDIYRMSKCLEEIEIVDTTGTCDPWQPRKDNDFHSFSDIPLSLRKVVYTMTYPLNPGTVLRTTMMHPSTSITFLEISIDRHDFIEARFHSLRFPKLDTLIVHEKNVSRFFIAQSHLLFQFLEAHPTIHTLDLPDCPIRVLPHGMPEHILPNLSSLSLRPNFLADLHRMAGNIGQITYLSLLEVHPIRESSSALQSFRSAAGGFQFLKRCLISRSRCDYINKVLQYFDNSMELEWCTISFTQAIDALVRRLIHSLSKYPKLSRIDFEGEDIVTEKQLQHAAEIIPSLKKISLFQKHRKRMEITAIYDVQRDASGNPTLKKIYSLPESLPYIQDRRVIPLRSTYWRDDFLLDGWFDCSHVDKVEPF